MADLTPDEIATLRREHDTMYVLLAEYRACHDDDEKAECDCDTCQKATAILGPRE